MILNGTRVKIVHGDHSGKFGYVVSVGIVPTKNGAYSTMDIKIDRTGEVVQVKGGEAKAVLVTPTKW